MKFTGELYGTKVIGNYTVTTRKIEHEFNTYEEASDFLTKHGGILEFTVDPESFEEKPKEVRK